MRIQILFLFSLFLSPLFLPLSLQYSPMHDFILLKLSLYAFSLSMPFHLMMSAVAAMGVFALSIYYLVINWICNHNSSPKDKDWISNGLVKCLDADSRSFWMLLRKASHFLQRDPRKRKALYVIISANAAAIFHQCGEK